MNVADEIQRLQDLRKAGAMSDDEFAQAKARLLREPPVVATAGGKAFGHGTDPAVIEQQARMWAMFLHLSLLAGFLLPLAGLIVPILIWQLKKSELPGIDAHGKIAVNGIISATIYAVVSFLLIFVFIGIPLLSALGIAAIVVPIIGGIKANNGEVWPYPLTIPFLK